jgi:cyclophilin family peptidyl-prolyl cis-trans isomerase
MEEPVRKKWSLIPLVLVALLAAACGGSASSGPREAAAPVGEFSCNPTGPAAASYDGPEQVIREGRDYQATITMANGGQIVLDLFPEAAPITVNNFVFLACQGFYDGVTFHRVLPGFVAQGGDPTGTGTGGPGYTIAHEADNGLSFDRPGLISMAHTTQPHSTGSQFFITFAPVQQLDPDFTVFGEVVEGMDVALALTPRDPQQNPNAPPGDVIQSIRVVER